MNSFYCPGVLNRNSKDGLNSEEMIEIMFLIGGNKKVQSISITDYNPKNEDYRTGRFLCNMIYYFMLGFKKFRK